MSGFDYSRCWSRDRHIQRTVEEKIKLAVCLDHNQEKVQIKLDVSDEEDMTILSRIVPI